MPGSNRAVLFMRYALLVARLNACPFCRALYPGAEAHRCPDCGLKLVAMENLPTSLDVAADEEEAGEVVLPEQRLLPWNYFGRMRGAMLVIAVVGLLTFFTPWVELRMPDLDVRSGFDLADCLLTRNGVRCGRAAAGATGLCQAHASYWYQRQRAGRGLPPPEQWARHGPDGAHRDRS